MGSLTSHLTDILNEYGSWDNYMKEKDKEKMGFSICAEETPKYNWTTTKAKLWPSINVSGSKQFPSLERCNSRH